MANEPIANELSIYEVVAGFIEQVESLEHHILSRGGQQVSYHGDFASATPSVTKNLVFWKNLMKKATEKEEQL